MDVAESAFMICSKTGLKGGDAIVLQVAKQYGIPLLTKDKEIKKKVLKGTIVFEPSGIVTMKQTNIA